MKTTNQPHISVNIPKLDFCRLTSRKSARRASQVFSRAFTALTSCFRTSSKPSFRRARSITSCVLIVERPACFAKDSRSRLTFSIPSPRHQPSTQDIVYNTISNILSDIAFIVSHTYLPPKHLTQCSDKVRRGVDVFGEGDGVDRLAYAVPEGGFEAFFFLGFIDGRHNM